MRRILLLLLLCAMSIPSLAQDKRCKGIKKNGESCKSVFVTKEGWCRVHNPNAIRCAKDSCKMVVKIKGDYCRFHIHPKS